ncbi:hypothetical protein [Pedobacter punctiformis]|uniref:Uncharacterized protein n=1 Tax=Pedobacter punctiformis TaxID=3004097 RepID=A0ABT4LAJ4_9SPHI|nr:hypothetical protein [Pedobacter sp. HCMS5-2]MCZ4244930.1 hypothetical protein [Pedobacter sp. HCMS5-2]
MTILELIDEIDRHLGWKLYLFEQSLNRQMLLLKYGPTYIDNLLDEAIKELDTDKIFGTKN